MKKFEACQRRKFCYVFFTSIRRTTVTPIAIQYHPMRITIEKATKQFVSELHDELRNPDLGEVVEFDGSTRIQWETLIGPQAFENFNTIEFIVNVITDVGVSVFSSWLYDKLIKGGFQSVKIEDAEVPVNKTEIQKAVSKQNQKP